VLAAPATSAGQASLTSHREVPSLGHAQVAGRRSPDEGAWGYGSTRRGRDPTVGPRLATRLKRQGGRWASCGLVFPHDDHLEVDHRGGHRRDSRSRNLHAFHGHGHAAKPRAHGEDLPVGLRDTHQDTEERRARTRARAVLEQRSAERSAYRLQQKALAMVGSDTGATAPLNPPDRWSDARSSE
jgi:hypothetical protein